MMAERDMDCQDGLPPTADQISAAIQCACETFLGYSLKPLRQSQRLWLEMMK